MEDFI